MLMQKGRITPGPSEHLLATITVFGDVVVSRFPARYHHRLRYAAIDGIQFFVNRFSHALQADNVFIFCGTDQNHALRQYYDPRCSLQKREYAPGARIGNHHDLVAIIDRTAPTTEPLRSVDLRDNALRRTHLVGYSSAAVRLPPNCFASRSGSPSPRGIISDTTARQHHFAWPA